MWAIFYILTDQKYAINVELSNVLKNCIIKSNVNKDLYMLSLTSACAMAYGLGQVCLQLHFMWSRAQTQ